MKTITRYIGSVLLLLLLSHVSTAQFQPAPVVRSQEKTIVDGKIYYIHTVQKNQTLYSISKAYDISVDEIKNVNPRVDFTNLPEGIAIRIPEAKVEKEAEAGTQDRDNFLAHKVKRKETVYSIARKYGVDDVVVHFYNPWAKEGIRPNQTLWIPAGREMYDISAEARANDAFYVYTVKEKETLYSIARVYGVEVDDIINANPELHDGLKAKQVIKIPKIPHPGTEDIADTEDTLSIPCITPDETYVFNVALMLPFFASHRTVEHQELSDSLAEDGVYPAQQRDRGLRGKNFAEFYEGFLLAVDSLKKTGLSVNLHVFDTERDTLKTKRIVRDLSRVQPDLIIGPVYAADVDITGRFAGKNGIPLVSPLSTRSSLVESNSSIIQVFPSRQAESYAMANYIRTLNKGNIIMIYGADQVSVENSRRFRQYLLNKMPVDESGNPLSFSYYRLNDSLTANLGNILSKEQENLLVVFSESEPEVNSLVTRLILRSSQYPIVLFGMPSWQGWTNIDLNFLHTLQLHLITPFFTDFYNKQVRNFLKKSRNHYGYEPYEVYSPGYNFSMLGYDIGLYFLSALRQYGKNFMHCSDQAESHGLLSKYHFIKKGTGGFVNNSFSLIHYRNDYTIENAGIISGAADVPETIQ